MKKRKKRKLKKNSIISAIIMTIFLIFVIFGFSLLFSNSNNEEKLKDCGYNNIEIKEIKKLTNSEINTILKYDYNSNLIYIIESENYNPNKLDLYLKYTSEYKNIDYLKIIKLINSNNFDESKISKYIELLKKYNNVEGIIIYINNYSNKIADINENILSLLTEKYFIPDYLNRYIKYYNKNKSLSSKDVITNVNAKLDYTFYTDSSKADLSKGMYTLVNKFYYLDKDYEPTDIITISNEYTRDTAKMNKTAYENFVKMADAAKKEGLCLKITTAYRDYNFQSVLYNNYVKSDGAEKADTYSARPGYSEHQLGYSADLTNKNNVSFDEFKNTDEYKWLQNNAYKYGFIMRYPEDKVYITGYVFEAWHYRYVGVDIATYIYENDITYEEYYEYFLR